MRTLHFAGVVLIGLVLAGAADAADCADGDLAREAHVSAVGAYGPLAKLVDEAGPAEGSAWDHPEAIAFTDHDAHVQIEFDDVHLLRGIGIQADANDYYAVDTSVDRHHWRRVWLARPVSGSGLRTRSHELAEPVRARFLRLRVVESDGSASVSGVAAFCKLPQEWPLGVPSGSYPSPWLSQSRIDAIKLGVALVATGLFVWGLALRRAGRSELDRRVRDGAIAAVALVAAMCWWNLFAYHFYSPVHDWEQFHYYMGSKYQKELRYERLYDCAAVADAEDNAFPPVAERTLRNLSTNTIVSTHAVLADPNACKLHFEDARWSRFKADIAWFRLRLGGGRWEEAQRDHGYNGTPVWGIAGSIIANTIPLTDPGVRLIAALDSLLLFGMWAFATWAFGWRGACVAAIWWGTNYAGRFWWVGGGFLRQDWLVLSVVGIGLVRTRRHALGGAALTAAALLRIFPAFIVAGLVLKWAVGCFRARSLVLPKESIRFVAGCAASAAVLIGLSFSTGGGPGVWSDFAQNSQLHLSTALTNNIGLEPLLSFEPSTRARVMIDPEAADPYLAWKETRTRVFGERQWLAALLVLGMLALLARAVEHADDWVALVLGVGLIPFATNLGCYYYSVFLVYGLLWDRARERVALPLSALAAVTCLLPYWSSWYDEVFAAMSAAILVFVAGITALWPKIEGRAAESEAGEATAD